MSAFTPLELVILEGEQAGAKIALENNASMSIGADIDNDVIIRDIMAHADKFALCRRDQGAELQVLAGEVEIAGELFKQGQKLDLPMYTPIRIGSTLVAYGEPESLAWQDLAQVPKAENAEAGSQQALPFPLTLLSAVKSQPRAYQKKLAGFAILSTLLVFSSVIMAHRYKNPRLDLDPAAQLSAMKRLLESEGYVHVTPKQDENQRFYITGYLADQDERVQLEKLLDQTQTPATIDVTVGEDLASDVFDIYRVKGMVVKSDAVEPGVVEVTASELHVEKLEKIKQVALRDVDGLKDIKLNNTLPSDVDKENGIDGIVFSQPDKRIVLIVEGEPSYFITSDRSRYYVGSRLPSGYVIEEINEDNVLVSRSGVSTRLRI